MQYQQFLKRSQRLDFGCHPLNFHSYFEGHYLFDDPKTTFSPANAHYQSEPHLPNKRERYRTRLIAEISSLRVAGKDHLKRYILHKFRNNCKRNTIRVAFTNAVKFLKFIQSYRHSELETLRRSDIEDFVQFEQDRGMSAATLCRGGELQEDKLAMTETLNGVLKRRWDNRDKTSPYVFHNTYGARYTYTQKRDTMKKLCRKAGVKIFGFHAIRHHVASILADSGKASLSQIQKMLRHRRTTTTDNYIKTLDPQLRQVANVLDEQGKMGKKSESSTIGSTI